MRTHPARTHVLRSGAEDSRPAPRTNLCPGVLLAAGVALASIGTGVSAATPTAPAPTSADSASIALPPAPALPDEVCSNIIRDIIDIITGGNGGSW